MTKAKGRRGAGGEVRFRGGKWEARWYDPDGARRSKRFATKQQAQEFATEQQINARKAREGRGTYTDPRRKGPLFKEAASAWLDTSPGRTPKTRLNYAAIVHRHLLPEFGGVRIDAINPSDLKRYRAKLERAGKAPGTIKNIFRVLSPIFEMAIDDEHIARNPVRRVRLTGGQEKRATIITPTQVKLLASVIDSHYAPLVLFTAYTGLRAGEVAALRWRHLDLAGLSVTVESSVAELSLAEAKRESFRLDTTGLVYGTTKSNRARTIRFPSFLVPLLGLPGDKDALVFRTAGGSPLRWDNWRKFRWLPAVEKAHALDPSFPERFRFHDLRHTCASVLINRDYNPKAIQAHMGHSSIQVTFDIYGHLFDDWHADLPAVLDEVHREAPLFLVAGEGKGSAEERRTA